MRGVKFEAALQFVLVLLASQSFWTAVYGASNIDRASNDSLLWGPYRSNLYFGVRPRKPNTFTTGLFWGRMDNLTTAQKTFRHACEQNEIKGGYGWQEYDPRTGGRQTFFDSENFITLSTDFVKLPGSNNQEDWAARVSGTTLEEDVTTTVLFYIGMESFGAAVLQNEHDESGYKGTVTIKGESQAFENFRFDITEGPESNDHPLSVHKSADINPLDRTRVFGFAMPTDLFFQARNLLFQHLQVVVNKFMEVWGTDDRPPAYQLFLIDNTEEKDANMFYVQKMFRGNFQFDIVFSSASSSEPPTSEDVTKAIETVSKDFKADFAKAFPISHTFDTPEYKVFAHALFSNLIGGIGYFYGDSAVDRSYASAYEEENDRFWEETEEAQKEAERTMEGPFELLSAVPSRPFFPRGFLWDEGFHLLPIADFDIGLTVEILKSWMNLMDEDGWIAREQILGPEARSKVPVEFQIQYPHFANPPTLFLTFEYLLDKSDSGNLPTKEKELVDSSLKALYPLLRRNYLWYRKTQRGDIKSYEREAFSKREGYRWRGRTLTHLLTSGLDDYPRAPTPHPGELHLDLISWIGMMTRMMKRIAVKVGEEEDVGEYKKYETAILRNLDDLHWNEKNKMYCDATVNEDEENVHVCHKGYISLFPFITGLLPADSPKLGAILDMINDPNELWSDFGIRSLSKKDEFYGAGENYWRGPVWMNVNYMVLDNLRKTAEIKGPHQKKARGMYNKLRKNLVETVYKSWQYTGYAWEQYDPDSGEGKRTQHFTGWTSLVVKMMCMPELKGPTEGHSPDEL